MRIYFIGAHSTGKTTLARYVAEQYKLPLLNEVARTILAEREYQIDTMRSNLQTINSYQYDVFCRQMAEEEKHHSFVSDRSFDNLAYSAQHSRVLAPLMEDKMLKHYLKRLKEQDTLLFFVRPSRATMKNDGVREFLNWDGIVSIDAMIKFMLEMWGLRYFQISSENMQERTRLIDSILSLIK